MIKRKLERYVKVLNNIEDNQDKFLWIMDFGKNCQTMKDEYRLKEFEVPGCQSQTWLVPHFLEDKIYFSADSAALISKGMVCLLADVFSGSTSDEIKAFETKFLNELKLEVLLTPGRNNGVYSMLKKIRYYAKKQD